MHERKDRIAALGADVIFVACDEPAELRAKLVADVALAFPVACDPARTSYDAWGLHRAAWWRIWLDPAVWLRYVRLLLSGERLRGGGADPLQLGGDFIVAEDGIIVYARPQRRDDRPPIGTLLREIEGLPARE